MTSAVYGMLDAFHLAARLASKVAGSGWGEPDVRVVTSGGRTVQGYGGHPIASHGKLSVAAVSDIVIVAPMLGDIEAVLARQHAVVAWLSALAPRPAVLAAACTGTFFLAEAGLLDGRRVTTNPLFRELFAARYPAARLENDARVVDDGTVVCAASTSSVLDLAVHLVDRFGGHDLALATAKALFIDKNPGSQRPYLFFVAPRDHGDAQVLGAQEWIEQNHARSIEVGDIARANGMSLRNLSRRLQSATGLAPSDYLRAVRLESAKRLLDRSDLAHEDIANQVGYADPRAFSRAFRVRFGISPGAYRRRFGSVVG
ncbi:MAG: hypothetical protein RL701_1480 [Pseudomonadota bacterium]